MIKVRHHIQHQLVDGDRLDDEALCLVELRGLVVAVEGVGLSVDLPGAIAGLQERTGVVGNDFYDIQVFTQRLFPLPFCHMLFGRGLERCRHLLFPAHRVYS